MLRGNSRGATYSTPDMECLAGPSLPRDIHAPLAREALSANAANAAAGT